MTIIRTNTPAERSAALLVRIKAFSSDAGSVFDRHDTSETKYIIVAESGNPVSTCRLCPKNTASILIDKVAVVPCFKEKGYRQIAVEAAVKWAAELGYKCIAQDGGTRKASAQAAVLHK